MLAQTSGLGGTGMPAQAGGIGGTGIVGIITGFASICVNGVEVHYDADTPVTDNGQPGQASALAVGQLVVVNAAGTGDQVQARRVALLHVAIGPLQAVNPATGTFQLLGQRGQASVATSLAGLQPNQWVRVSGQRDANGDIVATHVQAIAPQAQAQLLGTLAQVGKDQFTVTGTPVTIAQSSSAMGLAPGAEVLVHGTWTGERLNVTHTTQEPTTSALGAPTHVVLEGYIRSVHGNTIDIDHREMTLGPDTRVTSASANNGVAALARNQKVRISARMDAEHRIHVERIETQGARANRSEPSSSTDKDADSTKKTASAKDTESQSRTESTHTESSTRSGSDSASAGSPSTTSRTGESNDTGRTTGDTGNAGRSSGESKGPGRSDSKRDRGK